MCALGIVLAWSQIELAEIPRPSVGDKYVVRMFSRVLHVIQSRSCVEGLEKFFIPRVFVDSKFNRDKIEELVGEKTQNIRQDSFRRLSMPASTSISLHKSTQGSSLRDLSSTRLYASLGAF